LSSLSNWGFAQAFALLCVTLGGATVTTAVVVRRRLRHLAGSARAVAAGLVFTTALLAAHMVPGAVGLLYPGVVSALSAASAAGAALLVRVRAEPPEPGRTGAADISERSGLVSWALAGGTVLVAVLVPVAWLRMQVHQPPTGVDALDFHLPDVARWVEHHGFWGIHQFLPQLSHGTYPNNGDVLSLLALLNFHDTAFARFVFVPWLALLAVVVYALGRELGAPRPSAAIYASAVTAVPVVSRSALYGVMPDVVMLFAYGAGLLFLLRHRRTARTDDLVLAGLGLGIAFGTKWYGVSVVAATVALWLVWRVVERRRAGLVRDGLVVIGLVALAGGFWLLRNLVLTGNPLFPLKVAPAGVTIFDAPPDLVRANGGFTVAHYLGDPSILRHYVWPGLRAALGYAPVALLAGALAAAAVAARRRREAGPVLALAVLAVVLVGVYAITPYSAQGPEGRPVQVDANTRYLVPALLVAAAVAASLCGRLPRARIAVEAVGAALVLDGVRRAFDIPARTLVTTAVLLAGAALLVLAFRARPPRAAGARLAAAAVLVLLVGLVGRHEHNRYDLTAWTADPAIQWLYEQAPSGHRIGLSGLWAVAPPAPPLPAMGPRLGNDVRYVGPFRRHMLQQYTRQSDYVARLRRDRIDMVIVGRGFPNPLPTVRDEAWARAAGLRELARSDRLILFGR
jgi:hypothetical protein